jgi:hypothetical protein
MRAVCVTVRDPFHPARHRDVREVGKRRAIRTLAPKTNAPFIAVLNGQAIMRADWGRKLADGDALAFVVLPRGGGGGGSNPLKLILTIAVMFYAPYLVNFMAGSGFVGATAAGSWMAGAGFAGTLAVAGVGLVGSMLINALIPPPKLPSSMGMGGYGGQSASPTYNIAAQGNTARLEAAIPVQYGRMLSYPDFAASPFVEYAENEQYLYQLFALGAGEYEIEQVRIEDTPVANFDEVSIEIVPPGGYPSLFPSAVVTAPEVAGQELDASYTGPFFLNAAGTACRYIGIDIVAPGGMYYANDSGGLDGRSATAQIEARLINDLGVALGGWVVLGTETISGATATAIRKTYRYTVAAGRYEVRVKRTTAKDMAVRAGNAIVWAGARGYLTNTVNYGPVTLIAMRARATNNLSQQSTRRVNVISTRKIPVYTGSGWTAPQTSRSAVWALVDAARNTDYGAGLTDARIDLAGLLALDTTLASRGDLFDARFDNFLPWWEAAQKIAGAVRSRPFLQGGILYAVRDQAQTTPVVLFNQRNILRGSLSIDYLMPTDDTADAVDVAYFDATTWQPRRVSAYLPGSTAQKPGKIDLFGVVNREHAYREGLYQAAANRYRRKLIKFSCEMEGFIPSFGDLIAISHDLPAWGQGGDVIAWDAGAKTLTLSEAVTFTAGTHYVGLSRPNGSVSGPYQVVATSDPAVIYVPDALDMVPYTGQNAERTRFAFGHGETWRQLARVIAIRPRGLTEVEIECVNEDPSVHTADVGAIAPPVQSSQLPGTVTAPVVASLYLQAMPGDPSTVVASWPAAPNAERYLVEQSGDGGVTWSRSVDTTSTSARFPALAAGDSLVRVAGVGLVRGPWMQASYSTAYAEALVRVPSAPSGLSATVSSAGVVFKWLPNAEADVAGYELREGATWATGNRIFRGNATQCTRLADYLGTRSFILRAFYATASGDSFSTDAATSVTISTLSAASVSVAFQLSDLVLTWTPPTISGANLPPAAYMLRVGASWATATPIATVSSTTWRTRVDWTGERDYWIAPVDSSGNIGAPIAATVTVIPPSAPDVSAEVVSNSVLLTWSAVDGSLPIATYEVRAGATWAGATVIGQKSGGFTSVFETSAGTFTYWVAAIDTAGNVGTPSPCAATLSAPTDYVLNTYYISQFAGTLSNAALDAGGALIGVDSSETWATHFTARGWTTPQNQIDAGYPIYAQPGIGSGYYEETLDYGATLATSRVTISYAGTTVAGSPTITCDIWTSIDGSTWTPYLGASQAFATNFRYVKWRITSSGAGSLWRLESLNLRLDAQLKTMSGSIACNAADSGGTIVYMTDTRTAGGVKTFVDVDAITITPSGTTALTAVYDFADVPNPLSFKVLLFNSTTGARVSATASFTVRGF